MRLEFSNKTQKEFSRSSLIQTRTPRFLVRQGITYIVPGSFDSVTATRQSLKESSWFRQPPGSRANKTIHLWEPPGKSTEST